MNQVFHTPEHLLTRLVRIQVAGAGGTGSHLIDALASLDSTLRTLGHPGFEVAIFDDDRVSRASVGRQRYTDADIGVPKAHVLVHRINCFYNVNYVAHARKLDTNSIHCDLLITATDSALFRAAVGKTFQNRESHTLWIDTGNDSAGGLCEIGHLGKLPAQDAGALRLPNIWNLYPELAKMRAADEEEASCSVEQSITRQEWPVNRMVATFAATLLWNLFRKGKLEHHGCRIDTRTLTAMPMPIDPQMWEFYGIKTVKPKATRPAPVKKAA